RREPVYDLVSLIDEEFRAKRDDDGCTEEELQPLRRRFEQLKESGSVEELEALYDELTSLPPHYDERLQPSDLEGIRLQRSEGPRTFGTPLSESTIYSKILGGLLGRAAGCTLGKPVEGW